MKPFFSIIVPCCDVEPYVKECLMSVINQPFRDWECLIGIETCKDRTEEVIHEIIDGDDRFKVFTGPRSGSCSASRNTGIDLAQGEYVIFLDGDDTIAEGSLQRIHDKIAERPDADIYPCAMPVYNEMTGQYEQTRDNYPEGFTEELTGPEAVVKTYYTVKRYPCPMLQLSVFRREYLVSNNLKCIYGLRRQDSEFAPRALYLAKRVIPIHEAFYIYRIRAQSVSTLAKGVTSFLGDYAIILKSLLAFHAKVSAQDGFDRRISSMWAKHWLTFWVYYNWFYPQNIRKASRERRLETLKAAFADGFDNFDCLVKASTLPRRIAAWWVKIFVRHPFFGARLADLFFICVYYPLTGIRDKIKSKGKR
jgi:glycosyltransferase involved in cell wall biosynthesis